MTKVILGKLIEVQNKQRRNGQNEKYISVQVQDFNGQNERCLLFHERVISDMPKVQTNIDLKEGRLYDITIGKQKGYLLKIINESNQTKILRISQKKLEVAQRLAINNPQDLTKKSFLTDMFD